ncbi:MULTISPECIES: carboxymuconolactone decarboxylase family protein [unclassified Mesorhizobium]|uniref:carboxymuconolactone decarboxylase family protein n=1 Tax=unclassified Mesorhizobium TaxID=325217 RepID=UPI0010921948|nr:MULTISPECIES: carboxymuconolactone decarboxylase family protein [unclassified Mesorhizobium]TGP87914.1 carboxymuconolactone decarboxylase family protein [Mesorhizobium sp. M8A.F.Ca.ET.218.01.1.1]TGT15712.1 carboxymuconolactone decarboxylase family protein [Mesorhizobium sp. M8A.F.Ca.ET.213.01.1.1]
MSETAEKLKEAQRRIGTLAKASPDLFGGFARVSKVATTAGSFTAAQKELMAVAIAVSKGCEDCILYHLDAALKHGAKEAELVEALDVAIEMGGGPAVMYGAKALEIMRALQ